MFFLGFLRDGPFTFILVRFEEISNFLNNFNTPIHVGRKIQNITQSRNINISSAQITRADCDYGLELNLLAEETQTKRFKYFAGEKLK